MEQIILDFDSNTGVALNKGSKWPLNITNLRLIAVILKQNSITAAVFAFSDNVNCSITPPKQFRIHPPFIVFLPSSMTSSKILLGYQSCESRKRCHNVRDDIESTHEKKDLGFIHPPFCPYCSLHQ
jgi:hypothetical protein